MPVPRPARRHAALLPEPGLATLSSVSEGFPNVVGGGHGCGVPCVVTDVGDCAAIVGDIARVVPPKDPAALAVAWQRTLVLDPAARRRLGEPARARVEAHFGLSGVVRRYEDLYASLARG